MTRTMYEVRYDSLVGETIVRASERWRAQQWARRTAPAMRRTLCVVRCVETLIETCAPNEEKTDV